MEILGIEKVSFVDWEGLICATIFTGGCNFFCPFCHNSGLVKREVQAIDTKDILEYLSQRKNILEGVTISGGEPTMQPDLERFIIQVREMGYKIKLDTNGAKPEILAALIEKNLLDYVAMDIKNNYEDYGKITGLVKVPIEKIQESVEILSKSNIGFELRTTLVKEFHTQENIEKLGENLKGQKILYLQKFVDSGACNMNNLNAVDKNVALSYKQILEKTIDKVILRGY